MGIRHGHITTIADETDDTHIPNNSKHVPMDNIGAHITVKQILYIQMSGQTHSASINNRHAAIIHSITNMHTGTPKKNTHEAIV